MAGKEYNLLVTLRAQPEMGDALESELNSLAQASLATPMCTEFIVARSNTDSDVFLLLERFPSAELYPEHVATPHAQDFLNRVVPNFILERSATEF